jgi:hypothetical protein
MPTTHSYDAPGVTDVDTVRFLLGDTDPNDAGEWKVSNEEIQWAYDTWFPLYHTFQWVAATIADTIAARYAGEASYSADGVSVSLGPVGDQYRALAITLREQHKAMLVGGQPDAGGMTAFEPMDYTTKPFSFGKGFQDDREAGAQEYGGVYPAQGGYPYGNPNNDLVEP